MPEEANRRLTDHLSQLLLAHSEGAVANLTRESIDPSRIHLVGNTMIDSVLRYLPHALAREAWSRFGVEPGDFALVTLHRPPLLMTPIYFAKPWKRSASSRASCRSFSPCTHELKLALASAGWRANKGRSDRLIPCPPLGYLDFLALEAKAAFVLTDSGGVQGGNVRVRRSLLHLPRHDGTSGHCRARNQHCARCRSKQHPRDPCHARG
jgi:UDP-N-acetylglucosamine 2-epimerase (non-hydrolysing)